MREVLLKSAAMGRTPGSWELDEDGNWRVGPCPVPGCRFPLGHRREHFVAVDDER